MTTATTTVRTFLLPDLGEGLTEGELVRWLVAVGETIVVDQPVAEVETAKSVVEVPSPFGGVVATLHGDAGAVIDVGSPLISVDEGGSSAPVEAGSGGADGAAADPGTAPAGAAPGTAPVGAERALSYREEERAGATPPAEVTPDTAGGDAAESSAGGSGNVLIGYGTSGTAARGRTRRPRGASAPSAPAPAAPAPASAATPASPAAPAAPAPGDRRAPSVISPIVRRLARELGIALDAVTGTGRDGLILRRDVEAAAGTGTSAATTEAAASLGETPAPSSPTPAAAVTAPATGETDRRSGLPVAARTEMRGVRKVTAEAMSRSRREIPEATVWVDVDATRLLKLRERHKAADPAGAPGLLALIGRFTAAALMRYPELNARIDGDHIVTVDGVNLGFAAQTDRGLVVPSVPNAHRLNARELDAELKALTARARDGKCTPEELRRGTFTLNNYGVFGVDGSAAIINHPEVGILGVGRIIEKPWVVKGRLRVRRVTQLTLAFDHRVCDGGTASAFLMFVARAIEDPTSVLAEL
ncbi:dihydrolipoamide acetyltransferase family protein [Tersicoccus sp. Bi-70]|uniref:dihydrolipoamide acetyltransferase family protein n=1 Tax=Tersicoccus sp. Bi-70 TaxID=1897634 RepID=UPI00097680DC|nr:dihydrolipoamide acetyltransferase family protein [Tersicoccus sp. Bi-70]OMH34861.1 branched-chain alpha-keto acid dehydrogenase subunit E2 [Tersicoccus sp. Bi-70]